MRRKLRVLKAVSKNHSFKTILYRFRARTLCAQRKTGILARQEPENGGIGCIPGTGEDARFTIYVRRSEFGVRSH